MLLIFCGMVTTELIRGEKMFQYVYARTVSDNDGERMTETAVNTILGLPYRQPSNNADASNQR